jgi:hypothetical protein
MVGGLWPLVSLLMAAVEIQALPYYQVTLTQALLGAAAGVAVLARDFAVVGTLAVLASASLFGALAAAGLLRSDSPRALLAEPAVAFLAAFFGTALHYPAVLPIPSLHRLRAAGDRGDRGARRGGGAAACGLSWGARRLAVAPAVLAAGMLAPMPVAMGWRSISVDPGPASLVVLGLDSLSHADDLRPLHDFADARGGTWYGRAVTPGLLTNAVWTSLLTMRPVREHGVFHTFQSFPPPATLVTRARARFRTVSVLPDQLTCAVGSEAGFDGSQRARGWRQLPPRS